MIFLNLKNKIKIFNSKLNNFSFILIYMYFNVYKFFSLLKNILNNWYLSLQDIIAFENINLNWSLNFLKKIFNFNFISFITQYNILDHKTGYRFLFNFINQNNKIFSLEKIFKNSNWLERELIEFFGFKIYFKNDTRNLLLDYNFIGNPLLKNFPVEGYKELYVNFETLNLDYVSIEFIQL